MDELIKRLATLTSELGEKWYRVKEIEDEIEAQFGDRLHEAEAEAEAWQNEIERVKHQIKDKAKDAYLIDGNKRPHDAVQIKIYKRMEYDDEQALYYCREHLPTALRFDKKLFEKVAAAAELDIVEIHDDPRVSISRDLSGYLEVEA